MIVGRIVLGRVYRHVQLRMVKTEGGQQPQSVPLWQYRTLAYAYDPVVMRQMLVYEGVDGPDEGCLFVCSLHDFVLRFVDETPPVEEPPPAPEMAKSACEVLMETVKAELKAKDWKEVQERSATQENVQVVWYPPESMVTAYTLAAAVQEQTQRERNNNAKATA